MAYVIQATINDTPVYVQSISLDKTTTSVRHAVQFGGYALATRALAGWDRRHDGWTVERLEECEACGHNAGADYYSLETCADGVGVVVCGECIERGDDEVRAHIVERKAGCSPRPSERPPATDCDAPYGTCNGKPVTPPF